MVATVVDFQEIASSFSTEIKIIWQARVKYFWFPVERKREKEKKKIEDANEPQKKKKEVFFFF